MEPSWGILYADTGKNHQSWASVAAPITPVRNVQGVGLRLRPVQCG